MNSTFTPKMLLAAFVLFVFAPAAKPQAAEGPVQGLLVLRNGNLLNGKIQRQGEHYRVDLAHGQLQVRAEQVEMVCDSIDQAYQLRRENRGGTSADTHLELAGWCLRHNLFDYADQELREVEAIDPEHPRLGLLRRHLQQTQKLAARKQQVAAKTKAMRPVPPPNPETLEKAPTWARALFVRQIQPLVVQSCATTGCHQCGSEAKFQLNRLALDGVGHPQVTLQNLASTLEQIDWQSAEQSDLLRRATEAHGTESASNPLPPHKLKVLASWIEQLAIAHERQSQLHELPPVVELAALSPVTQESTGAIQQTSHAVVDPFNPAEFNRLTTTPEPSLPEEPTVPHVLAPDEPEMVTASPAK